MPSRVRTAFKKQAAFDRPWVAHGRPQKSDVTALSMGRGGGQTVGRGVAWTNDSPPPKLLPPENSGRMSAARVAPGNHLHLLPPSPWREGRNAWLGRREGRKEAPNERRCAGRGEEKEEEEVRWLVPGGQKDDCPAEPFLLPLEPEINGIHFSGHGWRGQLFVDLRSALPRAWGGRYQSLAASATPHPLRQVGEAKRVLCSYAREKNSACVRLVCCAQRCVVSKMLTHLK